MTTLDSVNGSSPSSGSGLHEAINRHQQALIKVNTNPAGQVQVNIGQMFLDLALSEVRIEVLFEALRDGVSESQELTKRLTTLLHKKSQQLEALTQPQIAIGSGRVPRNG